MGKIRVMLVDDQHIVRESLTLRLSLEDDIEVVGAADGPPAALALATELQPDVVLMDISMGEENGISCANDLHGAVPHVRIIMLSMHDSDQTRLMSRHAGAVAFIGKHEPEELLLAAIRRAG